MTFEESKDLCDDVRLIVDDDLVGLTKSERRKISALLTEYEHRGDALRKAHGALRVHVPGSEDGHSGESRARARAAIEATGVYP